MDPDDPWLIRLFDKLEAIEKKVINMQDKVKILWAVGCFIAVAIGAVILERMISVIFN